MKGILFKIHGKPPSGHPCGHESAQKHAQHTTAAYGSLRPRRNQSPLTFEEDAIFGRTVDWRLVKSTFLNHKQRRNPYGLDLNLLRNMLREQGFKFDDARIC
jgi:hypothetical protein